MTQQLTLTLEAPRKNADRIITLNCGVGRDSLTMLGLAIEGRLEVEGLGKLSVRDLDCVVFSDTGAEWPHTYALVDRVREMCRKAGVRFLVLAKGEAPKTTPVSGWEDIEAKAAAGGYHVRDGIMEDFQSRATVASLGKGDCTDNHKIQPIRRLMNDISLVRFGRNNRSYSSLARRGEAPQHINLIGIAADETSRLANGEGRTPAYVTERYPLVTMGIAKADEAPILERWGLGFVRKSGCFLCPYQPIGWFWALSVAEPAIYAAVVEYERVALARNPRMAATGAKKPIPEAVAEWRAKNPEATVDAVLDKQYSRCTKEAREALALEMAA